MAVIGAGVWVRRQSRTPAEEDERTARRALRWLLAGLVVVTLLGALFMTGSRVSRSPGPVRGTIAIDVLERMRLPEVEARIRELEAEIRHQVGSAQRQLQATLGALEARRLVFLRGTGVPPAPTTPDPPRKER
jgi:hypothetical protein